MARPGEVARAYESGRRRPDVTPDEYRLSAWDRARDREAQHRPMPELPVPDPWAAPQAS